MLVWVASAWQSSVRVAHAYTLAIGLPAQSSDGGVWACHPQGLPVQAADRELVVQAHSGQQIHGGAPCCQGNWAAQCPVMQHREGGRRHGLHARSCLARSCAEKCSNTRVLGAPHKTRVGTPPHTPIPSAPSAPLLRATLQTGCLAALLALRLPAPQRSHHRRRSSSPQQRNSTSDSRRVANSTTRDGQRCGLLLR